MYQAVFYVYSVVIQIERASADRVFVAIVIGWEFPLTGLDLTSYSREVDKYQVLCTSQQISLSIQSALYMHCLPMCAPLQRFDVPAVASRVSYCQPNLYSFLSSPPPPPSSCMLSSYSYLFWTCLTTSDYFIQAEAVPPSRSVLPLQLQISYGGPVGPFPRAQAKTTYRELLQRSADPLLLMALTAPAMTSKFQHISPSWHPMLMQHFS